MTLDTGRILRPLVKVRRALRKLPKNSAPEQIHKFRTRMRRMEATLDSLGLDSDRCGRRMLRYEKLFRRRAGKIRDMDVLTGLTRSLHDAGEDEVRIELLKYLGHERYRQARKLHRSARKHGQRLRSYLKGCISQIEKRTSSKAPAQAKTTATALVQRRATELLAELKAFPKLTISNIHEFRLKVKHARYVLQTIRDADKAMVNALGEVKDKIGEWHDWDELTHLARALGAPRTGGLFTQLRTTTEKKYDEALHTAQQFRNKYLGSERPSRSAKNLPAPAIMAARTLVAA